MYLWVSSIPRGAIEKRTLWRHGPYRIFDKYPGARRFTIETNRGNRVAHKHRIHKSRTDESFAVNKDEDDECEDLLDSSGRVGEIFDSELPWSEVMAKLLETYPYETARDNDDSGAGDTAIKFELAYIVGEQDNWCQTTEDVRMKSREPGIDHSVDYEDTTQEGQIQQTAEELVNQQSFL